MNQSTYLLQKLDCNCNDCSFMERDFETYQKWEDWHRKLDFKEFKYKKAKAITDAKTQNSEYLLHKARMMTFQFDKAHLLQYGDCAKFNKPVSFIPRICQLETQECFHHRKDTA